MPMFAVGKRSSASSVYWTFTSRWRSSACAATFASTSVTVIRTSGFSSRAPATSAFVRVMSALTVSWNTGACHAAVRRRAIVLRMFVSGTDSTSPAGTGRRRARRRLGALDVLGDDPALGPGAAQRRQLDAALAGDAARQRRRLDPRAVRLGAAACWLAAAADAAASGASARPRRRCSFGCGQLRRGRGRPAARRRSPRPPRRSRRSSARRAPRRPRARSSAARPRSRTRPPGSPCRCPPRRAARPSRRARPRPSATS